MEPQKQPEEQPKQVTSPMRRRSIQKALQETQKSLQQELHRVQLVSDEPTRKTDAIRVSAVMRAVLPQEITVTIGKIDPDLLDVTPVSRKILVDGYRMALLNRYVVKNKKRYQILDVIGALNDGSILARVRLV